MKVPNKVWGSISWVILGLAAFLLYLWYRRAHKPVFVALRAEEGRISANATLTMQNGRTFYSVADEILNHLWNVKRIIGNLYWADFSLKNTDEKALGDLLLTVRGDEFDRLSEVYLLIKSNYGMDQNPLVEELRKTFNSREQSMYLSHLVNI